MSDIAPLEAEIRRRITAAGPMPVGEFMALCLTDPDYGYYTTRDPFGVSGDFITAPEISQMFGEMIGLWMAATWNKMGKPDNLCIIELGPGRGTMMNDAMRAARVLSGFREAAAIHLVEISPALEAMQKRTLQGVTTPIHWHRALAEVPAGRAIIVANEFFDAMPINQAVKSDRGWHERQVGIDAGDELAFVIAPEPLPHFDGLLPVRLRQAPDGSIFEWRSDTLAIEIGRRLARDQGAALVIDYGHGESAIGETLQAVGKHAYASPLSGPGSIDLTAHVDFQALATMVEAMGVSGFGPLTQSQFLRRLGIVTRAAALKAKAPETVAAGIDVALKRLISEGEAGMGALFKVAGFAHPALGMPPGFEAA